MKKNYYFDSEEWNLVLDEIQYYYQLDEREQKKVKFKRRFEVNSNKLGQILHDMSNKIIKYKNLCSPENLNDVVNECICNCFYLLSKNKFNSKKGKSFSFLTRVIQNTATWYHYRNNTDIPFNTFQGKSFIEESEENLILYLAEYFEKCNYKPVSEIDTKTGKVVVSKNIMRKKELRLQPFYRVIASDFEDTIIKQMEGGTIIRCMKDMIKDFKKKRSVKKYSKHDVIIVEALLNYLSVEKKIDNITIRRIKKFVVNFLLDHMKKKRWKFHGKKIEDVERSEVIAFVNKVFEQKIKPFFLKNVIIKDIISRKDGDK